MKKTVYAILIFCLVIGVCLTVLDFMSAGKDGISVPSDLSKVVVELNEKARTDELLFTRELDVPSIVDLYIQSDDNSVKYIKLVSESDILGMSGREVSYMVRSAEGTSYISSSFVILPGRYSVYLTSEQTDGRIAVGYRETAMDTSEFERLYKIHRGDLYNPPEGYTEIYSVDLAGKSCKDEVVYTISANGTEGIGLSVYTYLEKGTAWVDLIGEAQSYMGLGHPDFNRICDKLEIALQRGEYEIRLNCEDAEGRVYIFLKR